MFSVFGLAEGESFRATRFPEAKNLLKGLCCEKRMPRTLR
jgi:hypothetical protein